MYCILHCDRYLKQYIVFQSNFKSRDDSRITPVPASLRLGKASFAERDCEHCGQERHQSPCRNVFPAFAAVPKHRPLFARLVRSIVIVTDVGMDLLTRVGRNACPQGWEIAMGTIAEEWQRRYLAEGWKEGRIEGRVDAILRLLARRFGELPPNVRRRLFRASIQDLDAWIDALLDAEGADEVFGEDLRT